MTEVTTYETIMAEREKYLEDNMLVQPYVDCPICFENIPIRGIHWECNQCKTEHCGECATRMTGQYGDITCSVCRFQTIRRFETTILDRKPILAPVVSPDFQPTETHFNFNGICSHTPLRYPERPATPTREEVAAQIDNMIMNIGEGMIRELSIYYNMPIDTARRLHQLADEFSNIFSNDNVTIATEIVNRMRRPVYIMRLPNRTGFNITIRNRRINFTIHNIQQIPTATIGRIYMFALRNRANIRFPSPDRIQVHISLTEPNGIGESIIYNSIERDEYYGIDMERIFSHIHGILELDQFIRRYETIRGNIRPSYAVYSREIPNLYTLFGSYRNNKFVISIYNISRYEPEQIARIIAYLHGHGASVYYGGNRLDIKIRPRL